MTDHPQVNTGPSFTVGPVFTGSATFSKARGQDWAAVLLRDGSAIAVLADGAGGHPQAAACATLAGSAALAALAAGDVTEVSVFAAVAQAHAALRTAATAGLLNTEARTTLLVAAAAKGVVIGAKHGDSTFAIVDGSSSDPVQVPRLAQSDPPFMGPVAELDPYVFRVELDRQQIVCLCSDGAAAGLHTAPPVTPYESSALAVIDAARRHGSRDDATVALLGYLNPGEPR